MTCAIKNNNISYFIYGTIGSIAEVRREEMNKQEKPAPISMALQ